MSDRQFKELCKKLDTLIKLTAMNALKGKNLTDQVEILSAIGLQPKEMSAILGTDSATVRTLKSRIRRRTTRGTKKETAQGKSEPRAEGAESL